MSTTSFTSAEQRAIEKKGFTLRMVCLPGAVIGLYMLECPWPVENVIVRIIWTLFTAYFLFCWTSCFHETAHQTLTRWRWFDIALGRILGTLMLVPYTVYRECHIRHHAYVNRPNDWELWPYSDPTTSRTFRRLFVVFDVLLGFIAAPLIYGRIYFSSRSPIKDAALRLTIQREYSGIVLFWSLGFLKLTLTDGWGDYVRVWLIPHILAGIMQTMRKLTEHLGMSSYDPLLGTRTVIGSNWITRWASFANFDIFVHGPHHRHPRIAHTDLKEKMSDYVSANPAVDYPIYPSYLSATIAMLPYLIANPGIGINAGAAPVTPDRIDDVTNFSADVTQDSSPSEVNLR